MNINLSTTLRKMVEGAVSIEEQSTGILVYRDSNYEILPSPPKSETDAEINKWQTEFEAKLYARKRSEEYQVLNQFELMTDDAANSTTTHANAIAAIKTKWPKDNSGPVE